MFATFDEQADAAFITFSDTEIEPGGAETTIRTASPGGSEINLDFDSVGRFLGIEILNATELLPASLLAQATEPTIDPDWWSGLPRE
ncbi:MAG: DUF2283 domain-containing protein [Bifidobacteriaceae bacterium]|jgi:uncharacterized protein YuzE|nr:DUF2283 domain-containing protein [Bifidobacteriaceae bacterium]